MLSSSIRISTGEFILKKSDQHRLSEPLRTLFYDFTMDQYGVSSYFFHWNKTCCLIEDSVPFAGYSRTLRGRFWEPPLSFNSLLSDPANVVFTANFLDFEGLMRRWTSMNSEYPNITNRYNKTALDIACRRGSLKVARLLSEHGDNIEEESARHYFERQQRSALRVAISKGHADIVQMLLKKNIESCAKDGVGLAMRIDTSPSVFFDTIYRGHVEVVKPLCEAAGVNEASQGPYLARTELMRTIRDSGNVTSLFQREGFKDLVDQAALRDALFLSLKKGDLETARTLLAMGVDANSHLKKSDGDSILTKTIYKSKYSPRATAFVELLLDSDANVDWHCSAVQLNPIELAVMIGSEASVNLLLARNVRCDRVDYPIKIKYPPSYLIGVGSLLDVAEDEGYLAISHLLEEHDCVSTISCPWLQDTRSSEF